MSYNCRHEPFTAVLWIKSYWDTRGWIFESRPGALYKQTWCQHPGENSNALSFKNLRWVLLVSRPPTTQMNAIGARITESNKLPSKLVAQWENTLIPLVVLGALARFLIPLAFYSPQFREHAEVLKKC